MAAGQPQPCNALRLVRCTLIDHHGCGLVRAYSRWREIHRKAKHPGRASQSACVMADGGLHISPRGGGGCRLDLAPSRLSSVSPLREVVRNPELPSDDMRDGPRLSEVSQNPFQRVSVRRSRLSEVSLVSPLQCASISPLSFQGVKFSFPTEVALYHSASYRINPENGPLL